MSAESPNLVPLNRTLDQELLALVRGASLECLVCGEFVLHVRGAPETSCVACPECRSILVEGCEIPEIGLPSAVQAG
jgi:hypothetical protein